MATRVHREHPQAAAAVRMVISGWFVVVSGTLVVELVEREPLSELWPLWGGVTGAALALLLAIGALAALSHVRPKNKHKPDV